MLNLPTEYRDGAVAQKGVDLDTIQARSSARRALIIDDDPDTVDLIKIIFRNAGMDVVGAFSGKDPTKVDRSAAYAARWAAKNVVAAGLADRVLVQLAYAIGVAEPVSIYLDTSGTGRISDDKMVELVRAHFKLTPRGIIETLDLRRPIFRKTAAFGHFGRTEPEFTWERTDKANVLRADAGL